MALSTLVEVDPGARSAVFLSCSVSDENDEAGDAEATRGGNDIRNQTAAISATINRPILCR